MTELALVDSLINSGVKLATRSRHEIRYAKEVRITFNRADVVYFEYRNESSIGSITAIEAKLRDWRKALRQAYRDRLFADRVYVALPVAYSKPAVQEIHLFRDANVGLIVVYDGKTKVVFHPTKNMSVSALHVSRAKKALLSYVAAEPRNSTQDLKCGCSTFVPMNEALISCPSF